MIKGQPLENSGVGTNAVKINFIDDLFSLAVMQIDLVIVGVVFPNYYTDVKLFPFISILKGNELKTTFRVNGYPLKLYLDKAVTQLVQNQILVESNENFEINLNSFRFENVGEKKIQKFLLIFISSLAISERPLI